MSSLTIYKDGNEGSTVISNLFIDEYMKDANDAQIKVYLYLVRMMSANLPTGISEMADKFNHTEKDIYRALRYWEKCHLLALEFDDQKNLTGIRFITPAKVQSEEARPLAPIVPLKLVSTEQENDSSEPVSYYAKAIKDVPLASAAASQTATPSAAVSAPAPSYSRDELKAFKDSPETSQVLFLAETYLQRNLSLTDIESLYFIHHDLSFTVELTDYLLQYCIEHGKKSFSYIRKVAMSWAEAGVNTPKQAKAFIGSNYEKQVYTILKLLGRNSIPTAKEAELVMRWYKDYAFPMEVIEEACGRTVVATDTHRLEYCDRILQAWKNAGAGTLDAVKLLDSSFSKKSKPSGQGSQSKPSGNAFNQFGNKRDYDIQAIEEALLSN